MAHLVGGILLHLDALFPSFRKATTDVAQLLVEDALVCSVRQHVGGEHFHVVIYRLVVLMTHNERISSVVDGALA